MCAAFSGAGFFRFGSAGFCPLKSTAPRRCAFSGAAFGKARHPDGRLFPGPLGRLCLFLLISNAAVDQSFFGVFSAASAAKGEFSTCFGVGGLLPFGRIAGVSGFVSFAFESRFTAPPPPGLKPFCPRDGKCQYSRFSTSVVTPGLIRFAVMIEG